MHYDAIKIEDMATFNISDRLDFEDKSKIKKTYHCHTQYVPIYPENDLRYIYTIKSYDYWNKWFTKDKNGNPKGLIEINSMKIKL